jgi:hypothetical protein
MGLAGSLPIRLTVQSDGSWFTAWAGYRKKASLQFVRFVSGKTKRTAVIEGAFLFYELDRMVAADGRPVLYTLPERPNSSPLVVENFQ